MFTLIWSILEFIFDDFLTHFSMKKFLKQMFLKGFQSGDDKQTGQGNNNFDLKFTSGKLCLNSEEEKQFADEDVEPESVLKMEFIRPEGFGGSAEPMCEEVLSKLKKVRNLTTWTFSGEKLKYLVDSTAKGDGWTLPADFTCVHSNQETRNSSKVGSNRVKPSKLLEKGIVPCAHTEEQQYVEGEIFYPFDMDEDQLPTKTTYDEINVCPVNNTKRDSMITITENLKTSIDHHLQQKISKSKISRPKQPIVEKRGQEDYENFEWNFEPHSSPPFTPLWEEKNAREPSNHNVSKHPSDKELPPSVTYTNETLSNNKFLLGTTKGPKRDIILTTDQDIPDTERESDDPKDEQLLYYEGLKKFQDFIVTDEPLIEDETLSLVSSSHTSDEDTAERLEENISNVYNSKSTSRSSRADIFSENRNFPNDPVIPTVIPLQRSSAVTKFNILVKEETNECQMNNFSIPTDG